MEYFNGSSVNQTHGSHHGHNLTANGNQLYNQVSFGNPSPPGAWASHHNILSSGPESPENQSQNSPHLSMLQASQITNFSNTGNSYFAPEKYGINMVQYIQSFILQFVHIMSVQWVCEDDWERVCMLLKPVIAFLTPVSCVQLSQVVSKVTIQLFSLVFFFIFIFYSYSSVLYLLFLQ